MSQTKFSDVLSTIWGTFTFIAIISILLAIVSTILGALVLLIGRFLGSWFEVRTFEAALVVLAVAALFVYVFSRPRLNVLEDYWDEDETWDDEEADEDEEMIIPPRSRNDPCPCGSGKKYKHCHGRGA
ncbi:MAG: SEC-C domain-containing protein [Anaerolineae bacterium]|nr:SEC-C domain-containing protein [Anaerolineae bacterium]